MDQAMAEYEGAILRYMQSSNVTAQKFADKLISKLCKFADVYDESTHNCVFIERVDALVRYSLHDL